MFQKELRSYSWWTVDLGVKETVKEVLITNRGDSGGKKLHARSLFFLCVLNNSFGIPEGRYLV